MKNPHTVTRSKWLHELSGKPTRKTYWHATCDQCGGFIASAITKNVDEIDSRAASAATGHRYICPAQDAA